MSRARPSHVIVLVVALLIGAGPYLVRAAGAREGGPTVANIDMARVLAESDARKAATARLQTYARTMSDRYDETARLQYLTVPEMEDYSAALNAETPTDAQKQKLAALKAESARRTDEAQKLMAKKDAELTAQDRTRLRELAGIEQQRPQALDSLKRLYQGVVQQEDARLSRDAQAQVRDIVNKLAKEQGVTQVFDTMALVVAPVDLTQQALKKVKKQ